MRKVEEVKGGKGRRVGEIRRKDKRKRREERTGIGKRGERKHLLPQSQDFHLILWICSRKSFCLSREPVTSCLSSFSVGGDFWEPQHSHSSAYPYLVCTLSKMSCFSYHLWARQSTWVNNGRAVMCLSALDTEGRKALLRAHSYSYYSKLWFSLSCSPKMLWTLNQKVQELVFSLLLLKLSLTSNAKRWESPSPWSHSSIPNPTQTFHWEPSPTSPIPDPSP